MYYFIAVSPKNNLFFSALIYFFGQIKLYLQCYLLGVFFLYVQFGRAPLRGSGCSGFAIRSYLRGCKQPLGTAARTFGAPAAAPTILRAKNRICQKTVFLLRIMG
jgi:hypothetical protein